MLHERALAIREAAFGPSHPDIATSLSNLALVLTDQGDLDGACALHKRALAIREAILGPKHPLTARSLNNVANILRRQGDLDGVRQMHERALAIRQETLGPDHPHTARSLVSLANVLRDQGDLDKARRLYEQALTIYETKLPGGNPDITRTRQELTAITTRLENANNTELLHRSSQATPRYRAECHHYRRHGVVRDPSGLSPTTGNTGSPQNMACHINLIDATQRRNLDGAELRGYEKGHLFQDLAALPEFGAFLQAPPG